MLPDESDLPWHLIKTRWDLARVQLKISLQRLPPDKYFAVVWFGNESGTLDSTKGMIKATKGNVAKVCEEEMGATLGYGPWPLAWWWMQNESDPLRRISVTNSWAEPNLMSTLREWREHAEERGYTRIAELCDYLQADELTHVRLATDWIRKFTDDKPDYRNELVAWSRKAVDVVQGFYNSAYSASDNPEPKFSFLRGGDIEDDRSGVPSSVVGE